MTAYLKVLSVDTIDSLPCVTLGTDSRRIIFDCGEGVQRLCVEHRVRFAKLEMVCLTKLTPQHIGGLPGLILTSADTGKTQFGIICPPGTEQYWSSLRHFLYRPNFCINFCTVENTVFEYLFDDITLRCVPIANGNSRIVSYVCKTAALPGKFDTEKAISLGIPKGPLFGKLKNGETIHYVPKTKSNEVSDQTFITVTPDQVLGPSIVSIYSAIVPSIDTTDLCNLSLSFVPQIINRIMSLIDNNEWKRYQSGGECEGLMKCMFHYIPQEYIYNMCYNGVYLQWMNSFGPNCQHVLLGRVYVVEQSLPHMILSSLKRSSFLASAVYVSKLRRVGCELFPEFPLPDIPTDTNTSMVVQATVLTSFRLVPQRSMGLIMDDYANTVNAIPGDIENFWKEVTEQTLLLSLLAEFAEDSTISDQSSRCEAGELLFLGTASAIPSKYRNVSGIAFSRSISAGCNDVMGDLILFDVGEGSWNHLLKMYCMRVSDSTLPFHSIEEIQYHLVRKLKLVWISHPHADHHLGLLSILALKKKCMSCDLSDKPLVLIAPPSILCFLEEYKANVARYSEDISGTFIGISTRQIDPSDAGGIPDAYWSHLLQKFRNGYDQCRFDDVKEPVCETIPIGGSFKYYFDKPIDETVANATQTALFSCLTITIPTFASLVSDESNRIAVEKLQSVMCEDISYAMITLSSLGVTELVNVRVDHCVESYGLSITFNTQNRPDGTYQPLKIAYSGDTRPFELFNEIAKNADVFIHEATFADDRQDDAVAKSHSTVSEAIFAGIAANAKVILLTHFSQRYSGLPKLPEFLESEVGKEVKIIPAFDFMSIPVTDIFSICTRTKLFYELLSLENEDEDDGFVLTEVSKTCVCAAGGFCLVCVEVKAPKKVKYEYCK